MDGQTWLDGNARYLAASFAWLRLKLQALAAPAQPRYHNESAPAGEALPGAESSAWLSLPADEAAASKLAQSAAERAKAAAIHPPPALLGLGKRLGLTTFEQEVLLLCAGVELDASLARLCALAQGGSGQPFPTFALARLLFDDPAWECLAPDRPLRGWRLVELLPGAALPVASTPLRADERIIQHLRGLNTLDDRLAAYLSPLPESAALPGTPGAPGTPGVPPSHRRLAEAIVQRWQSADPDLPLPIVQLSGADALSKQSVAAQAAQGPGLQVHYLSSSLLPAQPAELETLALLWQRESSLHPLALYLDAQDEDPAASERAALLSRFLLRADGVIFLAVRESWQHLGRSSFTLEVSKPTPAEQRALWESLIGSQLAASPLAVSQLAAQFNLNTPTIRQVVQAAAAPGLSGALLERRLWEACRAAARPHLDALAQRIELKAGWDDLILPPEQAGLLRQLAGQVSQRQTVYEDWGFAEKMNRGLGISALFTGETGTGKTMAAEVIANELQLNLYRIDLSAVVNKYIGETEKNLRRLFDAADDGGAILFFDEADAIFGKRSEVKDSHDRYANIEINYLLQRLESYRGLAILATNQREALDTAFIRRLRFIIHFPVPEAAERRLIWQRAFPPRTPLQPLDYDHLARFNLTGGNIHSIALNAAFLAARAGAPVSMPLVLSAIRSEYLKLEKVVYESDPIWKGPQNPAA